MMNSSIVLPRIDWDEYFLNIASAVSMRSTCPRLSVGAVITLNNKILTTGYNGAPPGYPHCTEIGCEIIDNHCVRTLHAERNALDQLRILNTRLKMYVTHTPCELCREEAKKYNVYEIIWGQHYGVTKI